MSILLLGKNFRAALLTLDAEGQLQRAVMIVDIAHAGPTIATLGLSLQVPLAVALDVIFGSPAYMRSVLPAVLTAGGAVLVLGGFCGITLQGSSTAAH